MHLVLNGLSTSSPSDSMSIIFLVSFHEFPNNFLRCLYHEKIGRQMFFPELCKRDPDREAGKKISREKQSRLLACIFEADYGNVRSAIVCVYIYVHICVYVGRARISSFPGNHGPEVTRKIISPKTGYTGSIYAIERRVASRRIVVNGYSATTRSRVQQVLRNRTKKSWITMEFQIGSIEARSNEFSCHVAR